MRFIFMAMLLVGCGTESKTVEVEKLVPFYIDTAKVDAKLLPHVMEFAGYCEKFGTSTGCKENFKKIQYIRIVESFPEKFVIGKCYASDVLRSIEILNWQDTDSFLTKALVAHELGHCILGNPFPHYNNEDDIMNSYILPEQTIFNSWPQLIKAMFLRAGGTLPLTQEENSPTVTQSTITESGGLACETREDSIPGHRR